MPENLHRNFALEVVQRLVAAGHQALWAGGCVRDDLMGHSPEDYDVATSALPDQVRSLFGKRHTLAVGESFGVIVVLGPGKQFGQVEVATFRQDSLTSDGRRPDSVQFSTAEEDAQRRDLTINGLFYDPLTDQLLDYVGGQKDLEQKIIRAIGNPKTRIQEDKLRMLRCIRFTSRFQFQLDQKTAEAIREMAPQIPVVSKERISEELRKMFADPNRAFALKLIDSLGLFRVLFAELETSWNSNTFQQDTFRYFEQMQLQDFQICYAILLRELNSADQPLAAKTFCKSLKLSNQQTDCIDWLVKHQSGLDQADQLALHQLNPLLSHPQTQRLLELTRLKATIKDKQPLDFQFCQQYLKNTPQKRIAPAPLVTGKDLIATGRKPGKQFAELLNQIRNAQLDEQIHTKQEALELIEHPSD
ncbi:MAG: CCA tRNA nucleotidyltransferase [Planctomycetaceae bacterium]|nr:CCA tRNA nucleotidyltransferase [Planctomycetaceae bacterium]